MTNAEAFNKSIIVEDGSSEIATIILNSKGIDPTLSDENAVSFAWGLIYSVTAPEYSQGKTSEKLSTAAITQRLNQAKDILADNDIVYSPFGTIEITQSEW